MKSILDNFKFIVAGALVALVLILFGISNILESYIEDPGKALVRFAKMHPGHEICHTVKHLQWGGKYCIRMVE